MEEVAMIHPSFNTNNPDDYPDDYFISNCRHCRKGREIGILIRPCICRGAWEFIHLICLQRLVERKYYNCEKCCSHFPLELNTESLLQRFRNGDALVKILGKQCFNVIISIGTVIISGSLMISSFIQFATLRHKEEKSEFASFILSFITFGLCIISSIYMGRRLGKFYIALQDYRYTWQLNTRRLLQNQYLDIDEIII